jgi:hypothetical protein
VGATELAERQACELEIVHPVTGRSFCISAEAVWIQPGVGVGLELVGLDSDKRRELEAFIGEAQPEPAASEGAEPTADENGDPAKGLYERIRELKSHERDIVARQGSLPERVALERCFQGAIWEGLLQNPQLTPPEVARIAKNPGLPAALAASIAGNAAWLSKPEIQRALLGNPRVSGPVLERVLKAIPRGELNLVATQASYRAPVRQAAKKLLGL